MARLLDEIHPGEILLEDFMKPMEISARRLAADIDVSPSRISELVHGQRPITADTALRSRRSNTYRPPTSGSSPKPSRLNARPRCMMTRCRRRCRSASIRGRGGACAFAVPATRQ